MDVSVCEHCGKYYPWDADKEWCSTWCKEKLEEKEAGMTKCTFSIAWVGRCKQEAEPGSTNCKKHQKLCTRCRKRLVNRECAHAGQFVCGRPLCDECLCPSHNQ